MKIPQRPPDPTEAITHLLSLDPSSIRRVGTQRHQRYLHWDELRRRTPPEGLDHVAWWALLKLGRIQSRRQPGLCDVHDKPFWWSAHDVITEHLHHVDMFAGGIIGIPEPIANPESKRRYYQHSLITEAITSSQLEGASTTREVAREMLLTRRKPRDQSERMILNNYVTMERIGELRSEPLSPELVSELHRLVTADTLARDDASGRFRRDDEVVEVVDNDSQVLHVPPHAATLPGRMAAMCAFANDETGVGFIHPALRAIILHFWLAYDHPYVDGNGRTARALFYWSMLRSNYWLFEYVSISEAILLAPVKYGRAFLYTETDDNDLTYFMLYHLGAIRDALDALTRFIEKRARDVRELEGIVRGAVDRLNLRQRELLSHALRHPGTSYTIAGHERRQGVVYQTARTDLLGLVDLGLLTKHKAGRRFTFRPVSELEQRLRTLDAVDAP